MLEDVTAFFCCGHQKFQPLADFPLPGELAEHWRSQRDFEGGIGFRRFHDRACGNLITLNQKLRTTRFVLRQSSLGSAGCRVAHASRVLVSASRRNSLYRKVRHREDAIANTRDACATQRKSARSRTHV